MHFADEVLPSDAIDGADLKAKVDDRELKVAQQLIDALTGEFKPERYWDEYREKVMELIERKARGERTVLRPEATEAKTTRGADLIAALEASLATSKAGASNGGGTNGKASKNGHSHSTHRRRKSA
jgi:DNA end-binding protein Ku